MERARGGEGETPRGVAAGSVPAGCHLPMPDIAVQWIFNVITHTKDLLSAGYMMTKRIPKWIPRFIMVFFRLMCMKLWIFDIQGTYGGDAFNFELPDVKSIATVPLGCPRKCFGYRHDMLVSLRSK